MVQSSHWEYVSIHERPECKRSKIDHTIIVADPKQVLTKLDSRLSPHHLKMKSHQQSCPIK